jgi:uncharacterized protein (TIGR00369 family)
MTQRTRTITWEDPYEGAALGASMGGLEYLKAMAAGEVPPPPIAKLLGFEMGEIEEGRVTFEAVPAEFHYNPIGVVHGGLAATMLDSVMGCAVHSTLPPGTLYTTLEMKVNLVRAITTGTGPIVAEGKLVHRGSRVATAEGRLFVKSTGKLLAHASTTCFVDSISVETRSAAAQHLRSPYEGHKAEETQAA